MVEGDETTALQPTGETRQIVCGWCRNGTAPGQCSHCGRDPAVPWLQRDVEPPLAEASEGGRPRLSPGQIRHRLRLARKELGEGATNAQLAEKLEISERTLARWLRLAS